MLSEHKNAMFTLVKLGKSNLGLESLTNKKNETKFIVSVS